jgi:hypothetical protein
MVVLGRTHLWKNAAFVAVLIGSIYLILAAIVTVPELLESTASAESDIATLTTTLQSSEYQLVPIQADFFKSDPFAPLLSAIDEAEAKGFRGGFQVEQQIDESKAQRERVILEYSNAQEYWARKIIQARSQALTSFERNARRKGNFERNDHFEKVLHWYERQLHEAHRELSECVHASGLADNDTIRWANGLVRRVRRNDATLVGLAESPARWRLALEQCDDRWEFGPVPPRQLLGSRLGPFGMVAGWLVQTESLSLALVVSLLGFGLLGASASTIIRRHGAGAPAPGQPLVPALLSVIVQGLSAAIVVFLVVEGGLSVFAAGSSEPNPYVLMLTCLTAAVFSEPVWEGAKRYLGGLVERWSTTAESGPKSETKPPSRTKTHEPPIS